MKSLIAAAVLSTALAAGSMAQNAVHPHDYLQHMTAKLGLNTEQQSQAAAIFKNAQATESSLHATMRMTGQALRDAEKSNNPAGMEQLAATIGNLTTQMTLAHAKAHAAFYQILTPEQRAAFDQLESQRAGHWRGARAGSQTSAQ